MPANPAKDGMRPFQPPAPWFNHPAAYSFPSTPSGTAYTLSCDPGSVAATGDTAGLNVARALSASPGAVSISGDPATPAAAITASPGSIAVTGDSAGLTLGRRMAASAGSSAVTGDAVGLAIHRVFVAAPGSVAVTGDDASLVAPTPAIRTSPCDVELEQGGLIDLEDFSGLLALETCVTSGASSAQGGHDLDAELYALLRNDDEVIALVAGVI